MNKKLWSMIALTLATILAAGSGVAEPTHPNEVGLYVEPDGTGPTGTTIMGAPVDVYLVLTRPTDVDGSGEAFVSVYGFECTLTFDPVPNNDLLLLDTVLPPGSIDIGRYKDINEGFLEFIVGTTISSPVLVDNEAAVMVTFTFMNLGSGITEVSLGPIEGNQSIPGQMAFLGGPEESGHPYYLTAMYSMGGSHDAAVFAFNGEAVAVDIESFGSVKALFR
jgi:hypothetical protein